jgi:hypothetical protein
MTNIRLNFPLTVIAPVAVAALTLVGAHDTLASTGTSSSAQAAALGTKCVGVDHAVIKFERCVPFPDTMG